MLQLVLFHFSVAVHICFFHFSAGFGLVEENLGAGYLTLLLCWAFQVLQPASGTEALQDFPPSFKE